MKRSTIMLRSLLLLVIFLSLFILEGTGEGQQTGGSTSGTSTRIIKLPPSSARSIVYVDVANTQGPWDGISWATALQHVQDGINTARYGDMVWVAKGMYYPTITIDRVVSFEMREGVDLYGGFAGNETGLEQRDWQKNETILSGDIGELGNMSDNSYHVVLGADNAILDGFIVTGGNGLNARPGRPMPGQAPQQGQRKVHSSPGEISDGLMPGTGGGMANYGVAPVIRNCVFKGNSAEKGGAMYNMSNPGGGRALQMPSPGNAPVVINTTFINNYARARGGAVSNDLGTNTVFIDSQFINNRCDSKGGAVYNDFGCSAEFYNTLFVGNTAFRAGAMGNDGGSHPLIVNSTFHGNTAEDLGPALYQGTGPANHPVVMNSIIWGNLCENGPENLFNFHHSLIAMRNSSVEGGFWGQGNVEIAPEFVAPQQGDYSLIPGSKLAALNIGYDSSRSGQILKDSIFRESWWQSPTVNIRAPVLKQLSFFSGNVVYVAPASARSENGRSWATALSDLQTAIDVASQAGADIWVAAGTYLPEAVYGRSSSFFLRDGVQLYGGFAGNEMTRDARDPEKHITVLSGDIGIIDLVTDNSYHVLIGADNVVLDGFTVSGGYANGILYAGKGGGLINYSGARSQQRPGLERGYSPIIRNCKFTGNYALEGGAIYSYGASTPVFEDCSFLDNRAGFGGAVVERVGVQSTFTNCLFSGNSSSWHGGALYLDYGVRSTITASRFLENTSEDSHGGAIYLTTRASQLEETTLTVNDSIFERNGAAKRGGAISNFDLSLLTVTNSEFTANVAGTGGGAIAGDRGANTTVQSCRFLNNLASQGNYDIDTDPTSSLEQR